MANTYQDATGVLLFDGAAVITPVIRMLFQPFKLDEAVYDEVDSERYIAVLGEDNNYDWDSYLEILIAEALKAFGIIVLEDCELTMVITTIGAHFGADLAAFAETIDYYSEVTIGEVVALALHLADGHNLTGYALSGSVHCDRPRLWAFGGWSVYRSKRYAIDQSSADVLDFAREIDAALASDPVTATGILSRWVDKTFNGITDEEIRFDLARRVGQRLCLQGPTQTGDITTSTDAEASWTRSVYVEARPCDEYGDGPGYARWEVTPDFIARVLLLQALCLERQLKEVRVADSPDVWGPGNVAEELRLNCPELVVTTSMFWFSDQPKHRSYAVETRGLWIDSFLRDVSGPGEPVYLDIDPSDIEEQDVDQGENENTIAESPEMNETGGIASTVGVGRCPDCNAEIIDPKRGDCNVWPICRYTTPSIRSTE